MPNIFSVKEKSTVKYTATLKDENGTAIPAASLSTLKLTLWNMSDPLKAVINSRNAQDVLNANNVTVDAAGLVTWTMQPADNAIQITSNRVERHRALFVFTWASGAKQGAHEVDFDVLNIEKLS